VTKRFNFTFGSNWEEGGKLQKRGGKRLQRSKGRGGSKGGTNDLSISVAKTERRRETTRVRNAKGIVKVGCVPFGRGNTGENAGAGCGATVRQSGLGGKTYENPRERNARRVGGEPTRQNDQLQWSALENTKHGRGKGKTLGTALHTPLIGQKGKAKKTVDEFQLLPEEQLWGVGRDV